MINKQEFHTRTNQQLMQLRREEYEIQGKEFLTFQSLNLNKIKLQT